MSETRTGGCLCGAVRFTARLHTTAYDACHCEMCRRWTGTALLSLPVLAANMDWTGAERIATIQSSPWARRAWCNACGSGLYYMALDGPGDPHYAVPIGLFDDANGLVMETEIWVDQKPDSFALAGSAKSYTRAEAIAAFGIPASPEE